MSNVWLPSRQLLATLLLTAACAVGFSAPAAAAPVLLSFDATLDDGTVPGISTAVAVIAGNELVRCPVATPCPGEVGELLFDDEFVNVSSNTTTTTVVYQLQGGAGPHPTSGYTLSGWPTVTTFVLNNFVFDVPGELVGVAAGTSGIIGAAGGALVSGTDFSFNASSLTIFLDALGILDGSPSLGTMTFSLTYRATQDPPPPPVAEPATVLLLGSAITGLALRRRQQRRS